MRRSSRKRRTPKVSPRAKKGRSGKIAKKATKSQPKPLGDRRAPTVDKPRMSGTAKARVQPFNGG